MASNYAIPKVGVQHGGPLFGKQSEERANDEQTGGLQENGVDLFSPLDSAKSRAIQFFFAPLAGPEDDYDSGVGIRHYIAFLITTFVATMFLTIFALGSRSMLASGGAGLAESAVYTSVAMAAIWYTITRFTPQHNKLTITCNPAIETARTFVMDGTGLVPWVFTTGVQLAAGVTGGAIVNAIGFASPFMLDRVAPGPDHHIIWFFPIVMQAIIAGVYVFAQKYGKGKKDYHTKFATAMSIFCCTLITATGPQAVSLPTLVPAAGNFFNFYSYNPAIYLGAGFALSDYGQYVLFLLIAFFVAPVISAAFYYGYRLLVKLTQIDRVGTPNMTVRFRASAGVGPAKASVDFGTEPIMMPAESRIGSDMGRSTALRNRESVKPLSVAY